MAEFSSACTGSSPVARCAKNNRFIFTSKLMGGVLGGLGLIIAGGCIIYFYNQLYKAFGPIARFEKNMGDSRSAYVLIGAGCIVVGVLLIFGIGTGSPTDIDSSFTNE